MPSVVPDQLQTTSDAACLWDDPHDLTRIRGEDLETINLSYAALPLDLLPPAHQLQSQIKQTGNAAYAALLPAQHGYLFNTLRDTGWNTGDATAFFAHMGRHLIHASKDRHFAAASWRTICPHCRRRTRNQQISTKQPGCTEEKCGTTRPRMYPIQRLGDKQYIRATTPNRTAFITIDVDTPGRPGGSINDTHPDVLHLLNQMTAHGFAPNLGGINPVSGKAQFIWFIDPVYSDLDPSKPNRPQALLKGLHERMNALFGGDKSFSHAFMRNPFYSGNDAKAYKWNAWHSSVYQMKHLSLEVNRLQGTTATAPAKDAPVKTGRDLILQAKANRERAQQWAQYAQELGIDGDLLEANDPDLIQGVRIRYAEGTNYVARDETAFSHALKTAIRLRKNGEVLSDDALIDAYLRAYQVAQEHSKDGRRPEIPPMRDLKTMARRVRGYATKTTPNPTGHPSASSTRVTAQERKVLATFGRRGAATSNKRRWANPDSDIAQRSREPLTKANQKRTFEGMATKARVIEYAAQQLANTGKSPTLKEISAALQISTKTAHRALKDSGISLPRGRPRSTQ